VEEFKRSRWNAIANHLININAEVSLRSPCCAIVLDISLPLPTQIFNAYKPETSMEPGRRSQGLPRNNIKGNKGKVSRLSSKTSL
jgi:hypothetical protein